jgi:hypothetical protein
MILWLSTDSISLRVVVFIVCLYHMYGTCDANKQHLQQQPLPLTKATTTSTQWTATRVEASDEGGREAGDK